MAEKFALYLPYKALNALSSGSVTDSQFREFIMGLAEYDRSGAFPASSTAGFAMMYELLKPDLDYAKAKYEDIVEKRREAGRNGGKSKSPAKIKAAQNNAKKPYPSKPSKTKQNEKNQANEADDRYQKTDNR